MFYFNRTNIPILSKILCKDSVFRKSIELKLCEINEELGVEPEPSTALRKIQVEDSGTEIIPHSPSKQKRILDFDYSPIKKANVQLINEVNETNPICDNIQRNIEIFKDMLKSGDLSFKLLRIR